MINRIHFNAFGGGLYPGGAYIWMCFFVYKGTGLQLGNLVPKVPSYPSLRSRTFCEFPPALRLGSATENKLARCL